MGWNGFPQEIRDAERENQAARGNLCNQNARDTPRFSSATTVKTLDPLFNGFSEVTGTHVLAAPEIAPSVAAGSRLAPGPRGSRWIQ